MWTIADSEYYLEWMVVHPRRQRAGGKERKARTTVHELGAANRAEERERPYNAGERRKDVKVQVRARLWLIATVPELGRF